MGIVYFLLNLFIKSTNMSSYKTFVFLAILVISLNACKSKREGNVKPILSELSSYSEKETSHISLKSLPNNLPIKVNEFDTSNLSQINKTDSNEIKILKNFNTGEFDTIRKNLPYSQDQNQFPKATESTSKTNIIIGYIFKSLGLLLSFLGLLILFFLLIFNFSSLIKEFLLSAILMVLGGGVLFLFGSLIGSIINTNN